MDGCCAFQSNAHTTSLPPALRPHGPRDHGRRIGPCIDRESGARAKAGPERGWLGRSIESSATASASTRAAASKHDGYWAAGPLVLRTTRASSSGRTVESRYVTCRCVFILSMDGGGWKWGAPVQQSRSLDRSKDTGMLPSLSRSLPPKVLSRACVHPRVRSD